MEVGVLAADLNPSLILGVMAILCLLVACGVTIKGFGVGAEGATRRTQVFGATAGALLFAALAWFTWPSRNPSPTSPQAASPQSAATPRVDGTQPPSREERSPASGDPQSNDGLSIPSPAGKWFAGVKYRDDLQYPRYAFTYQLTFDAAGQLKPFSSWWRDGPHDPRPIRSGSLSGSHLSLLYDAPNGVATTLDAKLVEKQEEKWIFDTTLSGERNDPSLPPSQRKVSVQAVLYLEREP